MLSIRACTARTFTSSSFASEIRTVDPGLRRHVGNQVFVSARRTIRYAPRAVAGEGKSRKRARQLTLIPIHVNVKMRKLRQGSCGALLIVKSESFNKIRRGRASDALVCELV